MIVIVDNLAHFVTVFTSIGLDQSPGSHGSEYGHSPTGLLGFMLTVLFAVVVKSHVG